MITAGVERLSNNFGRHHAAELWKAMYDASPADRRVPDLLSALHEFMDASTPQDIRIAQIKARAAINKAEKP